MSRRGRLLWQLGELQRTSAVQSVLFHQAVADRLGLNLTDFECYGLLELHGAMPAGQLAALTGLTTGAITHAVDRLELAGWVTRRPDPADRRRVILEPNMARQAEVAALFDSLGEAGEALLVDFSDADLAIVLKYLETGVPMMQSEIMKMRGDTSSEVPVPAPAAGIELGRLVIASGTPHLTLRVDSGLFELFRAQFEDPPPRVRQDRGMVRLEYPRGLRGVLPLGAPRAAAVTLNGGLPWHIEARNGLAGLDADLRGLDLRGFEVRGGLANGELRLPRPTRFVTLRIGGGLSGVRVVRPAGVPVGVRLRGGASQLALDDQTFGGLGGNAHWESAGYAGSTERYELDLSGGANALTLTSD